jgi:hypoxanthine phosphoribosyltransferase
VRFAHPSESEFARILDFYGVRWQYEPRSYALRWEGKRIIEMFTPDFYLPDLDLYVELTTLRQSLVTEKNGKLRRLRAVYPEVKIKLLYKRDYHRLLAKYGFGPLADPNTRGIERVLITADQIQTRITDLGAQISRDYAGQQPVFVGVLKGVFCFMADITRAVSLPLSVEFMSVSQFKHREGGDSVRITKDLDTGITGKHVVMVEDVVDTGMTLNYLLRYLSAHQPASLRVCALLDKRVRRLVDVKLDYVGFEVPDEFLVGYGLDYMEKYRNLPFIGVLRPEPQPETPPSAPSVSGAAASTRKRRARLRAVKGPQAAEAPEGRRPVGDMGSSKGATSGEDR